MNAVAGVIQFMFEASASPDATTHFSADALGPLVEVIESDYVDVIPVNFRPSGSGGVSTMTIPLSVGDESSPAVIDWCGIFTLESGGTTAVLSINMTPVSGVVRDNDYVNVVSGTPAIIGDFNMARPGEAAAVVVTSLSISLEAGGPVVGRIYLGRKAQ